MQTVLWCNDGHTLHMFGAKLRIVGLLGSIVLYLLWGQESALAHVEPSLTSTAALAPATTLADVQPAVVRVEAVGAFAQLGDDGTVGVSTGTAFLIDPSGIAVTNNHVVTGAARLTVYLDGESTPRAATVLGVSECADLAVIKIQGSNFPYLQWRDTALAAGAKVFAAGFPQGTFEYTLEDGIVTQANTDGHTDWSSLSHGVLRHSARIEPGNSGGPLLDEQGRVVAVNFASGKEAGKYYAITAQSALGLIKQLKGGNNIDSIGINGQAFSDGDEFSGIWVRSVESGSPADKIRIRSGDIVSSIEQIRVAADGTMKFYCEVLQTRQNQAVKVTVLRLATNHILQGRLHNGNDGRLEVIGYIEPPVAGTATPEVHTYKRVKSSAFIAQIPERWADTAVETWQVDGEVIGTNYYMAPDVAGFKESWSVPGIIIRTSSRLSADTAKVLDGWQPLADYCTYDKRYTHSHTAANVAYTGHLDVWTNCGNANTTWHVLALRSSTDNQTRLVEFYAVNKADVKAYFVFRDNLEFTRAATPTPTHTATPIPTATPPPPQVAMVSVETLNVRQCAGTNCTIVARARRGNCFTVIDQARVGNSPWFRILDSSNQTGWIAGAPYSVLAQDCSAPPPPTPIISSGQACVPFKNHFNTAATITMTGEGREWTFYVQPRQTHTECFTPGDYTWSISVGEYKTNNSGYIGPGRHPEANIYREF